MVGPHPSLGDIHISNIRGVLSAEFQAHASANGESTHCLHDSGFRFLVYQIEMVILPLHRSQDCWQWE